jgi:glycosyltransferase involved in cell wall biosynthesis
MADQTARNMPAVSVLMMFHRVTPYLVPAVRSVLTQTFRDLELVLVDDGTGLGTAPLGELGRDPRIQLVSRSGNGGVSAGHNLAVTHARGKYLAKLDYDDIAMPDRIESQIAVLEAEPRLGLVSSRVDTIDEQGRVTGPEFCLLGEQDQYNFTAYTASGVTSSYTGRRDIFERCLYRPEFSCAPDYDFLARAVEVAPVRGLPGVLTQYRRYRQQTVQQRASQLIVEACVVRLLTARRRHGRPEDMAGIIAEFGRWLRDPPSLADVYACFACRSLDEGFAPLGVYHARKLLSVRRDAASCARAARVLMRALRIAPRDAVLLSRMFFTGPVRAHGLKQA